MKPHYKLDEITTHRILELVNICEKLELGNVESGITVPGYCLKTYGSVRGALGNERSYRDPYGFYGSVSRWQVR